MIADLMLTHALVVTVNPNFDIVENGYVAVSGGRIASVGAMTDAGRPETAASVIDAAGGIVMPGLVNAHTHLPMTLFRGLADDLPLDVWLNAHMFPAEARHIRPESAGLAALLACAEMLRNGVTTCCDGYFHEDAVAQAVRSAGIRGVLGQGVIDFPAPGVPDPSENIATAAAYVRAWQGQSPRITPSVFCHAPYTCSAETLVRAKQTAVELGVLFQIHAAETRTERENCLAAHGESPVAYLSGLGVLDKDTLVVHAVWLDTADIEILARSESGVVHCPQSNMKLAAGVAPVPAMRREGIPVGLGTDGAASNNDLDLLAEAATAALLHKVHTLDPTAVDAATAVRMATIEGARAIGLGDVIGSIEPGKAADLIVIDTRAPHLVPLYHPASHLVYAARGSDVRHVVIDGEIRVRDRRLTGFDLDAVMADVAGLAETIRKDGRASPR